MVQSIQLDPTKGDPDVEVIFGQAQIGVYQCFLWDSSGNNPNQIAHGNNVDSMPDRFPVGTTAVALKGRFISWQIAIQTATPAPGQLYSVIMLVRQDNNVVPGGLFQQQGQFDTNSKALVVFGQFS